eukprot:TRINITY_DN2682_c0_g1_i4.p1 TRINITY_DN2682_c0_g1~~TRINITY_DN2682_c0_g1_i4.p1  ORF type:complete len:306 (+),score=99.38 TRINITY_DN2682_c0_g1_i4:2736-3653(+)
MVRVREKSKVFTESKPTKELEEQEAKNNGIIDHYAKKIISTQIDLETNKLQHDDIAMMKEIDLENTELVKVEAVLNRDIAIANGKIAELENMRELNTRYIEEEATQKRRLIKEQDMLQKELDIKSRLQDAELKKAIAEKEHSQVIELSKKLEMGNFELEYLISSLRSAEDRVKGLAEEKMRLGEELSEVKEAVERAGKDKEMQRSEMREETHSVELLSVDLGKLRKELEIYNRENRQLLEDNERMSKDIPELRQRIETLRQKVQLNEILKEVDLDELKMLRQNNMAVNDSISNLITRWESLEANL